MLDDDLVAVLDVLKFRLWPNAAHRYNAELAINELDRLAGRCGIVATALSIDQTVTRYRNAGNSDPTINRKLSFFRKLIKGAFDAGYIPESPRVDRLPEITKAPTLLSNDQINRALAALEASDRESHQLITFLADTGSTMQEALALRWSDITHRHVTFWSSTGYGRTIPLTQRASKALTFRSSLPQGPFSAVRLKGLRAAWRRSQIDAGIGSPISPSGLRYCCEARLVQQGVDTKTIHRWMGYRTPRTSSRFPTSDDLRGVQIVLENADVEEP
ncbi:site-specific tyrosine recombinase XerD [Aminobacter sp. MSH1]|uniref:tyrosine-type recombinase/integrase n=1 Tax=Aminobacter sp. MSH1 TaxID=374606 RepID=UPI000D505AD2|nr:tyrosine-type recombinase/integrase [Aminobacter sp. MSH1]AWC25429.1 site-specific tyrosine recombinase XerD [Aminobacter sp. MSH1]